MLHVQEVRGQSTLGGIGINTSTLALLLSASIGSRALGVQTMLDLADQMIRHGGQINCGGFTVDHIVDMLNVCLAQFGDVSLNTHQPEEDLRHD